MAKIGIDLGTSNTLVAKLNSEGQPEIIEIDGDRMIPSIIYVESTGGNSPVGKQAEDMWADPAFDPDRSFRRWKLTMGEDCVIRKLRVGGAGADEIQMTPEKLTTYMVEHVVRSISQGHDGEPVDSVLVTVPHGWRREKPEKCRATRMAAADAKYNGKPITVQQITVSEPVAAAAYWLWQTRQNQSTDDFTHKTLMVCDVGGGTFDISLVLVGDINKPLDVIDAINNDFAGDYVDALILAWVCRQFNAAHNTTYPEKAEEILDKIASHDLPLLRGWSLLARNEFKEKLSQRIEQVMKSERKIEDVKAVQYSFDDHSGNHLKVSMGINEYLSCLEPFYEESRNLIRTFLNKIPPSRLPYSVVFAGGGSRIYGLRDRVVLPVLKEFFSEAEANRIMNRIEPNKGKLDQAIVMGAALIANGIVSVQERLLHDIGFVAELPKILLEELKLPVDTKDVLIMPLIEKGKPLPTSFKSSELGIKSSMKAEKDIDIQIVIDDESDDLWIQKWSIPHPSGGKQKQLLEWVIDADNDGALTIHLRPEKGSSTVCEGRIERKKTGRASIVIGGDLDDIKGNWPRVRPEVLRSAIERLGSK